MNIETLLDEIIKAKINLTNIIVSELQALIPTEISAIQWEQYTPYFDDGSQCYFNVHDPSLIKDDDKIYYYSNSKYESILTQIENIILLDSLSDIMLFLFGDHVQVTVYKNSYTIEPFNHE